MGKKKRGRCVKKNVGNVQNSEPEELKKAPHSFVFYRGLVGYGVQGLVKDFRKVMEPFTAASLQVRKKSKIKDYVSVAGFFNVTHFCIFTHTELGVYMKIARCPRGPTLTFKVENYTLARDVIASLKKPVVYEKQFEHSPLIVLNGFSGEGEHIKLMTSMFQNMFPTINVMKVDLDSIRRCVLLNYDASSKLIDFRHYGIKVVPVGISKSVKKIIQHKVPNLSHYNDVSEYLTNPVHLSESEAEDDPTSHVVLPQKLSSRGNNAASTSAVRVVELGPRLTLRLIKIEKGLLSGDILHHELIEKSRRQKLIIKKAREQKRLLKEKRRKIQEENVRKKEKKKQLKEQSDKGKESKPNKFQKGPHSTNDEPMSDDNDAEWYEKEVGQAPDKELFDTSRGSVKRKRNPSFVQNKKKKVETSGDTFKKKFKFNKTSKFNKSSQFSNKGGKDKFKKDKKVIGSKFHKKHK